MKKKTTYTIGSVIVLIICVIAFVLPMQAGSLGKNPKAPLFGKYNKEKIEYTENSEMGISVSQTAAMYKAYGLSPEQFYSSIFRSSYEDAVKNAAYRDYVKSTGYKVPQSAINRELRNSFKDADGNFDSAAYKKMANTNPKEIQNANEAIEKQLFLNRFASDNFGEDTLYGLKESNAELDFLAAAAAKKRGFNAAVFPFADFPEEEKVAFAEKNAARFTQYDLSVITVEDKTAAEDISNKLRANEVTFENALTDSSIYIYSNSEGKLTFSHQYQIEDNILTNKADIAALAALKAGEISDVIETNETFSIFMANAPVEAADFTNDEILRVVGNYIMTNENTVIEDYFTKKAKEFKAEVANVQDFALAGENLEVTTSVIDPFPLNYGGVSFADQVVSSDSNLAGANSSENFLKVAFSLKQDELSEPLVLNNSIVVLQYTTELNEEPVASFAQLSDYDEEASADAIQNSPKLQDNFDEAYSKIFLN